MDAGRHALETVIFRNPCKRGDLADGRCLRLATRANPGGRLTTRNTRETRREAYDSEHGQNPAVDSRHRNARTPAEGSRLGNAQNLANYSHGARKIIIFNVLADTTNARNRFEHCITNTAILYFRGFPAKKRNHNPRNLPRNIFYTIGFFCRLQSTIYVD